MGKPVPFILIRAQGIVCMPDTFQFHIEPREEKRTRLIREDWQKAREEYIYSVTE